MISSLLFFNLKILASLLSWQVPAILKLQTSVEMNESHESLCYGSWDTKVRRILYIKIIPPFVLYVSVSDDIYEYRYEEWRRPHGSYP